MFKVFFFPRCLKEKLINADKTFGKKLLWECKMVTFPCYFFALEKCKYPCFSLLFCWSFLFSFILFFFSLYSKKGFADEYKVGWSQIYLEDFFCTIFLLKNFCEKRIVTLLYNVCLSILSQHFIYLLANTFILEALTTEEITDNFFLSEFYFSGIV